MELAEFTLPPLRQDLRLLKGSPDEEGAPRWLLFDAMRNKYFTISKEGFHLVRNWQPGLTLDSFLLKLEKKGHFYQQEEVSSFTEFMIFNNLIATRNADGTNFLYQQHNSRSLNLWRWLLHNYLFIRLPLWRPDPWLNRWGPYFSWLCSKIVLRAILILGILGILLVLRQWDRFLTTFVTFTSMKGVLFYGLTLAFVKSGHELGHAVTAWRHGCRVASMGIALLVLFPVLYTDTTDAWRLTSNRKRLSIVTAGVKVELYMALLATFLWNVLPDGVLRSSAFFIATTSWISSISVNISPFLRFDGYYALSDWLGIENLQPRAFALGRWWLRKWLLGVADPLPEPLPRHRARLMIAYAVGTWIYRFFLFLGIALLVYHFFFKALGIVLFIVEIFWFILKPMANEIQAWWAKRTAWNLSPARLLILLILAGTFVRFALPVSTHIRIPAVLTTQYFQQYYAPEPAQVTALLVQKGDTVSKGQMLVTLKSDQLQYTHRRLEEEINLVNTRLARSASSPAEKARRVILEHQRQRLYENMAGIEARMKRLTIRASQPGKVTQSSDLHPGLWVDTKMTLLSVADISSLQIVGYLNDLDVDHARPGQTGIFIADQGTISPIPVSLQNIDIGSSPYLTFPELGSIHGGEIAVRSQGPDRLVPEDGRYRVRFEITIPPADPQVFRQSGIVVLEAAPRSVIWYHVRRILAILIRESGF